MAVYLNAFPFKVSDHCLEARVIPYDKEQIDPLRADYKDTQIFRRRGYNILVFSSNGQYPVTGEIEQIVLRNNLGILCFLVINGLDACVVVSAPKHQWFPLVPCGWYA